MSRIEGQYAMKRSQHYNSLSGTGVVGGATASQWTHNKSCSSNGQNGKSHNIKYITVRAFRAPTNLQILKMQNSNSRNDSK